MADGNGRVTWIKDKVSPQSRGWEEFYRNRWQHDKIVRSTHGVNCTGSCTWNIYVKDGIVHPGLILRLCNKALSLNVRLGPWIHVGSALQNYAPAQVGEHGRADGVHGD